MSTAATIENFYAAFARRDGDAMAAAYAPDARFHDPVFGDLTGTQAGAMWKMLTARADDLEIELADHTDDSAHWIARYTFTQTGRHVVNDVHARFRFAGDGRFAEHVDRFSFWRWSRQALGPPGVLLGWTPLLRRKVGGNARAQLAKVSPAGP